MNVQLVSVSCRSNRDAARFPLRQLDRSRILNSHSYRIQPLAHSFEARGLSWRNNCITARTDIEQDIAIETCRAGQHGDDAITADIVFICFVPIIGKRMAHAARRFPQERKDTVKHAVFGRTRIPNLRHRRKQSRQAFGLIESTFRQLTIWRNPPVIRQAFWNGVVVFGDVILRVGVSRIAFVIPRHARHEIDETFDALVLESPVDTSGIVDAEFQTLRTYSLGQFADNIPRRMPTRLVGIWHIAWPERKAVMVFRDENNVAGARTLEEPCPGYRIPPF